MNYDLLPRVGLGPVRLGMSRDEVRQAVAEPPKEMPRRSGIPMDFFVRARLQVEYGSDQRCRFVQAGPGAEVALSGKQLMGVPFIEVRAYLQQLDSSLKVEGADLTADALQVAAYAGSASKDPMSPVESIAVFALGYYGPPKPPLAPKQ